MGLNAIKINDLFKLNYLLRIDSYLTLYSYVQMIIIT